jgi:hypothetical protein
VSVDQEVLACRTRPPVSLRPALHPRRQPVPGAGVVEPVAVGQLSFDGRGLPAVEADASGIRRAGAIGIRREPAIAPVSSTLRP